MLFTFIKKEIIAHILTLRFSVTMVLFLMLIFASFYVTTNEFLRNVEQEGVTKQAYQDQLETAWDDPEEWRRRYWVFYNHGKPDAVPVPPLSVLAQGLLSAWPIGVTTTTTETVLNERSEGRNPLLGLVRTPDFVYIVNVVLSLLAILFVFDAICGEKESGTLRLILSNSVPRYSVLLGKWIGGYVVLLIPFLIAALGGVGYAWAKGALQLDGENIQRIILLLTIALLYISVFFSLGLFISTLTHRATTSLFICLFVWVGWILVIPNLSPVMAKIIYPTPSPQKISAEKNAVETEIELRKQRLDLVSGQLSYGSSAEKQKEELDQEKKERQARWDRFYRETASSQNKLAGTLARFSPSSCWVYSASALTQTGSDAYEKLVRSSERMREQMSDAEEVYQDRRKNARKAGGEFEFELDEFPSLKVSFPDVSQAIESALNDILILTIWNVLFFMSAFLCFLRYDAR